MVLVLGELAVLPGLITHGPWPSFEALFSCTPRADFSLTVVMVNRDSTTAEFLVRVAYAYNFLN